MKVWLKIIDFAEPIELANAIIALDAAGYEVALDYGIAVDKTYPSLPYYPYTLGDVWPPNTITSDTNIKSYSDNPNTGVYNNGGTD